MTSAGFVLGERGGRGAESWGCRMPVPPHSAQGMRSAEPSLGSARSRTTSPPPDRVDTSNGTRRRPLWRPSINNPNSPFLVGLDYSPLHIDLFTIAIPSFQAFETTPRPRSPFIAIVTHRQRLEPHTPEQNLPPTATMSKTFTKADVATHKDEAAGMYIIIDNGVYNITGTPLPPPILSTTPTSNHPPPPLRRLPRRAPRRRQDPEARRRQGRHQAVLEVPRQVGAGKVRRQPPGRDVGRDGEALKQ